MTHPSDSLQPCPFCGKAPDVAASEIPGEMAVRIRCKPCGCEKIGRDDRPWADNSKRIATERATFAWNRRALAAPGGEGEPVAEVIEAAWLELGERDDRTSPEEYPEMCLISFDELAEFMGRTARVMAAETVALTYEEAETLALKAIHDGGRGMIGAGRNHLHQRVARAILAAHRDAALPPEPVAWRPDREAIVEAIRQHVKARPSSRVMLEQIAGTYEAADAILALTAPPSASESEGADWLSDAHDEALDFLDRKYPDESEGA